MRNHSQGGRGKRLLDRSRAGRLLALALAAAAPAGCDLTDDVAEEEGDAAVGSSTQAISGANGLVVNGLGVNGVAINGFAINGLGTNGVAVNGFAVNGVAINGLYVNGLGLNGVAINGVAVNGMGTNGLAVNGIGLNGFAINGLGTNGMYVNGVAINGVAINGFALNGFAINGMYVNGVAINGGIAMNGLYVNGVALNGVALNGVAINGTTPATALKVGTSSGTLANLTTGTTSQATEFRDRLMPYLAYCALPATTTNRNTAQCATDPGCVKIIDVGGTTKYYWGSKNFAPEWKTGPMSASGSDLVEGCLKAACVANGTNCQNGMALNTQQEAQLSSLLSYMVGCALPPVTGTPPTTRATCDTNAGCVTIKNAAGVDTFYYGAIGLAPTWKTAALDATGKQKVSACLGARTNAAGEHVLISMRGIGLTADLLEQGRFRRHEGGFYGDLFSATPSIHACEVEGGDMAGRVCANGQCGFVMDGECEAACTAQDASGNYTACPGSSQVLNTFLPFQKVVAGGNFHMCAVQPDGTVWCRGQNNYGELGDGTNTDSYQVAKKALLAPDFPVDQIAVSLMRHNTFARKSNGTLWAWGQGADGNLGLGTTTDRNSPVQIALAPVVDITTGEGTNCAIKADGTLWCWGNNDYGEVGNNSKQKALSPVQVTAVGSDVVQVALSQDFTCALKADGSVWCWGRNNNGGLGDGTYTDNMIPRKVNALGNSAISLTATRYAACVLKADLTPWCWGASSQVGDGDGLHNTIPARVQTASGDLTDVRQIEGGLNHACVVKTDGTVWCWGLNDYQNFAVPEVVYWDKAAQVTAFGNNVQSVELGGGITWRTTEDRTVTCTGDCDLGQLSTSTPALVRETALLHPHSGACDFGESTVTDADDCAAPEVCRDGFDGDGDGLTDCADSDCAGQSGCP